MKKLAIALAMACASLQSCTIAVRTLGNPEPKAFLELDPATATRDSVVIALGSPQGRGLRRVGEVEQQLLAFNSFEGDMSFSGFMASGELLHAFVAVDNEGKVPYILGWQFGARGEQKVSMPSKRFSELLSALKVGQATRSEIDAAFGTRGYVGRRVEPVRGVSNDLQVYTIVEHDQAGGRLPQRQLLIGFDSSGILRDVLWWSPNRVDFTTPKGLSQQSTATVSTIDFSWPLPLSRTNSASASTPLDFERIEALIRTKPQNEQQVEAVLGPPTARGVRQFESEDVLAVAVWEHQSAALLGSETRVFTETGTAKASGPMMGHTPQVNRQKTYNLMDVSDARLMLFTRADGTIEELVWIRPERAPGS